MRIVIDGYNLLKAIPECRALETTDPDRARDYLLAQLGRYGWLRGHHITVVFDGWIGGHPVQKRADARGVHVIFSKRGERADDVIQRLAPQVAHRGVVVTSDRALASDVQRAGAEVISSSEFRERLSRALFALEKGMDDEMSDEPMAPSPQKKGTSRRASRAERQRQRRLRNL